MSRDLRGALHDWADAESRAVDAQTTDTATITTGLTRRVVRRRAVRAGTSVAAAAVLVGGVALGVHALDREAPVLPADPTPTPTSAPTAPTPTVAPPSPTAPAPSTPEVSASSIERAIPLPEGLLATTDSRWTMAQYLPVNEDGTPAAGAGLYLLAPDDTLYSVPTVGTQASGILAEWLPGTSLALTAAIQEPFGTAVVDLLTGETMPRLNNVITSQFVRDGTTDLWVQRGDTYGFGFIRTTADGTVIGQMSTPDATSSDRATGAVWIANPERTLVLVNSVSSKRAVDMSSLLDVPYAFPYPEHPSACNVRGWVDDRTALLECSPGGANAFAAGSGNELWLVPVGVEGGTARRLTEMPDTAELAGVWMIGDRIVAGSIDDDGTQAWWEVQSSGTARLSRTSLGWFEVVSTRDGELIVQTGTPGAPVAMRRLVAVDPFSGGTRTVIDGLETGGGSTLGASPRDLMGWNSLNDMFVD